MLRRAGLAFRAKMLIQVQLWSYLQEFMVLRGGEDEVFYTQDGQYANVKRLYLCPLKWNDAIYSL